MFDKREGYSLGVLGLAAVLASVLASVLVHGSKASWASVSRDSGVGPRSLVPREEIRRNRQLSDRMTELEVSREDAPEFDADLARLSSRERQHRERLPRLSRHPRLKSVVSRVSARRYQPTRRSSR